MRSVNVSGLLVVVWC